MASVSTGLVLTLAYGEYRSTDYWGMFAETLPFVFRVALLVLVVYAVASLAAQVCKWHWVGVPAYIVGLAIVAPSFAVTGAWGPAHVGMEVGLWSVPLLGAVVVCKVVVLYRRDCVRARVANGACAGCGYDRRACATSSVCPECGVA